jgi:hypothetical protein
VTPEHLEAVEKTLLLLSEARERAEAAARRLRAGDAPSHVVVALETTDSALVGLYNDLTRDALFSGLEVEPRQLRLAG